MSHTFVSDQSGYCRVSFLNPSIARIRMSVEPQFEESLLSRYGIVPAQPDTLDFNTTKTAGRTVFDTGEIALSWDQKAESFSISTAEGQPVLSEVVLRPSAKGGFDLEVGLEDREPVYGLGDVTRDRLNKRGFKTALWVRNVASYVPIPVLISFSGWGLFVNSTYKLYVDAGAADGDVLRIHARSGPCDLFLFAGSGASAILGCVAAVTGAPKLLPRWAYGLTFVSNQQANAREMLDDCQKLRENGMPADVIGLEPGWMSVHYDKSIGKEWHPERFYIPPWARGKESPQTFAAAARRLGFRLSLWLCCEYDLTWEEERRRGQDLDVAEKALDDGRNLEDFEQDANIGHPARYMETSTVVEEPWFEHLKKFVDDGASAFKMDGAYQVNEHPDRMYGNGLGDDANHNLYPTILNRQMDRGYVEYTGERSLVYSSGGFAGIQQYAATWAGDTGGGPKPLASMLNHGLSGHSNVSCDMEIFTAEGIHFGFLQPWSQICSWAYWRHPWLLGEELLKIFIQYNRFRYRIIPYIYSMAHKAYATGMPIMRAMELCYPGDEECRERLTQYMFGDCFLVSCFSDRVYFPEGEWVDYWTGKLYRGPGEMTYEVPPDRGGGLFAKAGAIVPRWNSRDCIGCEAASSYDLQLFPGAEGSLVLYEDDGITEGYREGEVATTELRLSSRSDGFALEIGRRTGRYSGMDVTRSFSLSFSGERLPADIVWDQPLEVRHDAKSSIIHVELGEIGEAPASFAVRW